MQISKPKEGVIRHIRRWSVTEFRCGLLGLVVVFLCLCLFSVFLAAELYNKHFSVREKRHATVPALWDGDVPVQAGGAPLEIQGVINPEIPNI